MAELPRAERLLAKLSARLRLHAAGTVEIVRRTPNTYTSTFPSEVMECRLSNGETVKLFCKYYCVSIAEKDGRSAAPFYEIEVYRHVLSNLPLSVAALHGSWLDTEAGEGWLLLEYLEGSRRLLHTGDQLVALEAAARWLGAFHRIMEERVDAPTLGFMRRFDASYYRTQLERILERLGTETTDSVWLDRLDRRFDRLMSIEREAPRTVIHAEYYPKNVLVQGDRIVPVDWETASIGAGDFDLAMLLEGWDPRTVESCLQAYGEARGWPRGMRDGLALGTALVNLHWLGFETPPGRTRRTQSKANPRRLKQLRGAAESLGIV